MRPSRRYPSLSSNGAILIHRTNPNFHIRSCGKHLIPNLPPPTTIPSHPFYPYRVSGDCQAYHLPINRYTFLFYKHQVYKNAQPQIFEKSKHNAKHALS